MSSEANLQFFEKKNGTLKRMQSWVVELETRRNHHLAILKDIRADQTALDNKIAETINDDNFQLFPDADLLRPKTLEADDNFWVPAKWEKGKKDNAPAEAELLVEVAKLGNGEFLVRYRALLAAGSCKHTWDGPFPAKETAIRRAVDHMKPWIKGNADTPAGKALAKQIEALEETLPVIITAPPKDWKPAEIEAKALSQPAESLVTLFDAATLPATWKRGEIPSLMPFPYSGGLYVCRRQFGPHPTRPAYVTELCKIVPCDAWPFKVVDTVDQALDGDCCGLQVADPDGKRYVIDQVTTHVMVWEHAITAADEFEDFDGMEATAQKIKSGEFDPSSAGTEDAWPLPEKACFWRGDRCFINLGPKVPSDAGMPAGVIEMRPLFSLQEASLRFGSPAATGKEPDPFYRKKLLVPERGTIPLEMLIGPIAMGWPVRVAGKPVYCTEFTLGAVKPVPTVTADQKAPKSKPKKK